MKDREEWLAGLPQLLHGEAHLHNTLSWHVSKIPRNLGIEHEFIMTTVQMIRCYGQMDGVLSLIKGDGDIEATVTEIHAEIKRLTKKINSLNQRA